MNALNMLTTNRSAPKHGLDYLAQIMLYIILVTLCLGKIAMKIVRAVVFVFFTNNEFISASEVSVPKKFSSLELVVIDIFLSTSATKFRLFLCYRPPCHSDYSQDGFKKLISL